MNLASIKAMSISNNAEVCSSLRRIQRLIAECVINNHGTHYKVPRSCRRRQYCSSHGPIGSLVEVNGSLS